MNILAAIFFSLTTIPPPIIVILVVNVDHLTFDSSCFNYLYFWVLHDCVSCASPRPPWVNLMTRNSWFCASSCRVSPTAGLGWPGQATTPSWSSPLVQRTTVRWWSLKITTRSYPWPSSICDCYYLHHGFRGGDDPWLEVLQDSRLPLTPSSFPAEWKCGRLMSSICDFDLSTIVYYHTNHTTQEKIKSLYLVMYYLIDVSNHGNIKWALVRIATFCCAHRPHYHTNHTTQEKIKSLYLVMYCLLFNRCFQTWKYKMGPSAHWRVPLRTPTSDLDSWDSVDAKNGLTHLDWTTDTRDTKCVLKWVPVRIAAFHCTSRPQIWIPEIL